MGGEQESTYYQLTYQRPQVVAYLAYNRMKSTVTNFMQDAIPLSYDVM